MISRCLAYTVALVMVFVCTASAETLLEKNWGKSYQLAIANQTFNLESGKNLNPVVGLEGPAALNVMAAYRESFTKKSGEASTAGSGMVIGPGVSYGK